MLMRSVFCEMVKTNNKNKDSLRPKINHTHSPEKYASYVYLFHLPILRLLLEDHTCPTVPHNDDLISAKLFQ